MSDYSQPNFYRFNEDSFKLIDYVQSHLTKANRILDLGAGSGIIGIELANKLNANHLSLVEAQVEYHIHLKKNVSERLFNCTSEIVLKSFGEWKPESTYDLIVSNPPYFLPGHGQPSKDVKKNIARSFILDSWEVFLDLISLTLAPDGKAFIVLRNDQLILNKIKKNLCLDCKIFDSDNLVYIELFRLDKN